MIVPGLSELEAVDPRIMNKIVDVVYGLLRGRRFCSPVAFNLKRIRFSSFYADGTADGGSMEWSIDVQPIEADYTLTAYVDVDWIGDIVKIPAIFRDSLGKQRGFSEVSLKRFLYAGADLSESVPPIRPRH